MSQNILKSRHNTYGEFSSNAALAQAIKSIFRQGPNWSLLKPYQQEALDQTASKISRLLCGDPKHLDSWEDITLYNKLVVDRIRGEASTMRDENMSVSAGLGAHPGGYNAV